MSPSSVLKATVICCVGLLYVSSLDAREDRPVLVHTRCGRGDRAGGGAEVSKELEEDDGENEELMMTVSDIACYEWWRPYWREYFPGVRWVADRIRDHRALFDLSCLPRRNWHRRQRQRSRGGGADVAQKTVSS